MFRINTVVTGDGARGTQCDVRSVYLVCQGGFVDHGDAWRWGKMEHGFGDGEVFLPVGKAEFGF